MNAEEEASEAPGKAGPQVPLSFPVHSHTHIQPSLGLNCQRQIVCFYACVLPLFLKISTAGDTHKIVVTRLFFLLGFTVQEMENKEYLQLR